MPGWSFIVAWYLLASVITIGAFGADKLAARRGSRRTSERTLHTLELAGGWPGSLLAMHLFRHKRSKVSFYLVSWLIATTHLGVWSVALWRGWIG